MTIKPIEAKIASGYPNDIKQNSRVGLENGFITTGNEYWFSGCEYVEEKPRDGCFFLVYQMYWLGETQTRKGSPAKAFVFNV